MDHPKCRTCGERHRLGHCPKGFGGIREKLGRALKPAAEVEAKAKEIHERKRESDAAIAKPGRKAGKAAKDMKARASRVAAGRTVAKAAGAKASAAKVKRGRPRIGEEKKTIAARKPWIALKMSERTWWRRQSEKRV